MAGLKWLIGQGVFLLVLGGTLRAEPRQPAATAVRANAQLEVLVVDSTGRLLRASSRRASISRGLPGRLPQLTHHPDQSIDAQSTAFVLCGATSSLPRGVNIKTTRRTGEPLDSRTDIILDDGPKPAGALAQMHCRHSPLIRITVDAQDADFPGLRARSLQGELGGELQVLAKGTVLVSVPVGGPREFTNDLGMMRANLRVRVVRTMPGGVPPFGRDDSELVSILQREIRTANQLWGQCGIFFGDERDTDIAIVDPPEPYLISIGCGFGVAASGGQLNVLLDGRLLTLNIQTGQEPRRVALQLARQAERLGFRTEVFYNPRTLSSAMPSFDVVFRNASGKLALIAPAPGRKLTTDATLGICVGTVDLTDGLDHFTNGSSMSGTLEERSVLRAVIDQEPTTIDVVVVEAFSREGRIGESFVASEGGNLGNVVVLNRAAFRAGNRSYALAHELGHILLDTPGHPDDYGVDTGWNLMDSDAVDGTIFGPKHLTLDDCRRAVVQSGGASPGALLTPR